MDRKHLETVVTSHPNADLDALGSMVAARYLVPGAVPVLSHGAEAVGLHLLRRLGEDAPEILDAREVDPAGVRTLVVVDTRDISRLGPFADIAGSPETRLLIYDHHGDEGEAPPGHAELVTTPAGSNTAGMVAELMRLGIEPNSADATVMAAGVYEDTGMLTFAGVAGEDFEAARWLAGHGADLALVGRILRRELSPDQVHLFDGLLEAAHAVSGLRHRVVVAAVADPSEVQDAANVVQRVQDTLEPDAFFALIQQGNRVLVIARARREGPDVGAVLRELGGGGHAYAASGSLSGVPLAEAGERLETLLRRRDGLRSQVGELATRRVHTLPAGLTLEEAAERLRRYPLTRMPVVGEEEEPLGWVDQSLLARARAHGLTDQPVGEYVSFLPLLGPDAPLSEAEGWILDRDYPMVGVVEEGQLNGVLTRSDLIRNWREESPELPEPGGGAPGGGPRRDLAGRLRESLPRGTEEALERLGVLAAERGVRAFLVGGMVRDLILHRSNEDVDVVVEGDAIGLGKAFAERYGWHHHGHDRFGTAVLKGPGEERIDLATSRIEHYPYPAALPEVEAGSIRADLFRRDFTINALAVELDGPRFGRLLDPYGGLQDIRNGTIRVLHSLSFVEDPTRLLRAVRFEGELGFRIDPQSERLIRNAVSLDLPARLSGHRLFRELRYLFRTRSPAVGVRRLAGLDVLRFVHPRLGEGGDGAVARIEAGEEVLRWHRLLYRAEEPVPWQVLTLLLLWPLSPRELEPALKGFELRAREAGQMARDRVRAERFAAGLRDGSIPDDDPVAVYEALEALSLEGVLALMAVSRDVRVRQAVSHYIQHLRGIEPVLSGEDLKAMGVPQGPEVGQWLQALRRARIRGQVHGVQEEEALVRSGEIPA